MRTAAVGGDGGRDLAHADHADDDRDARRRQAKQAEAADNEGLHQDQADADDRACDQRYAERKDEEWVCAPSVLTADQVEHDLSRVVGRAKQSIGHRQRL